MKKTNFIGIGAQKCASTWIYQVFSDHPQAFVSTPKELDFFSSYYDRGFQWYENHFSDAQNRHLAGEISPSYFFDSDAPARAYAYNPDFKVILNLRDPIERAFSNHLHDIRLAHFSGDDLSFEAGCRNNPMYIEQGHYKKFIENWLAFFPREALYVVLQEDVQREPDIATRRLYEFLAIDPKHKSTLAHHKANESYLPKSREKEAFYQKIGSALRSVGLDRLASLLRDSKVYQSIKNKNRLDIRKLVPPMRQETRDQLKVVYNEDVRYVAELLAREQLPWRNWQDS